MIQNFICRCLLLFLAATCLQSAGTSRGVGEDSLPIVAVGSTKYVDIGGQYSIPCTVCPLEGGIDCLRSSDVVTQWWRDGLPLETTVGRFHIAADGSLNITEFLTEDIGKYHCMKSNSTDALLSVAVDVKQSAYSVPILFENSAIVGAEGDSLRLVCPVQQWSPIPPVTWYRDEQALTSDNQRFDILPAGVLHITNMNANTSGAYSCVAKTINGSNISSHNNITVTLNSTGERKYRLLAAPPTNLEYDKGTDLIVETFINAVNGEYVQWYRKGYSRNGEWYGRDVEPYGKYGVPNGRNGDTPSWWKIVMSKPNQYMRVLQAGEYKVDVIDSAGGVLESFPVSIGSSPEFVYANTEPVKERKTFATKIVTLECNVIGFPFPSVVWYKDGKKLELCHEKRLTEYGELIVEKLSVEEAGYYQCIASNEYGAFSQAYNLKIFVKDGVPYLPEIFNMRYLDSKRIEVFWSVRNRAKGGRIIAYGVTSSPSACAPGSQLIYNVLAAPECNCYPCLGVDTVCCNATVEVTVADVDYRVQITAFNGLGGQISPPRIIGPYSKLMKPSTTTDFAKFGLELLNFGNVIIIRWRSVPYAASYRVTLRYHNSSDVIPKAKHELIERSNSQNYTLIEEFGGNITLFLEVEAVTEPVTHVQNIQHSLIKSPQVTDVASVPEIHTIDVLGEDHMPGVVMYWTDEHVRDHYYVWYKCDGREALVKLDNSNKTLKIIPVERRCLLVVAPVTNGVPQRAAVAQYNRWCTNLIAPRELTVTPHQREGVVYANDVYDVLVEWMPAHLENETCEANYLLQWKVSGAEEYSLGEDNSMLVSDEHETIVKGLLLDVTYQFRVTAYTDVSTERKLSAEVSHTVGPPPIAQQLAVTFHDFPATTAVSWSSAKSGHAAVTLYVVRLYEQLSHNKWFLYNTTSIPAMIGVEHYKIEYMDLPHSTGYNVTIIGVNRQGAGVSSSLLFNTPIWIPTTNIGGDTANRRYTDSTNTVTPPNQNELSEIHIGVIIGVSVSVFLLLISAVMLLMCRNRFRKLPRGRGTGGRNQRAYDEQPLTVCTIPSQYELTSVRGDSHAPIHLVNGSLVPSLLDDHTFVSPPQLSINATSGQDSGIDGTTDDHRSSQDLGEYDVETEALMGSDLSLSSELSIRQHTSGHRWSCEMNGCHPEVAVKSSRTHTESESDSLLTDSNKHSINCTTQSHTSLPLSQECSRPTLIGLAPTSSNDNLGSPCTLKDSDGSTIGS